MKGKGRGKRVDRKVKEVELEIKKIELELKKEELRKAQDPSAKADGKRDAANDYVLIVAGVSGALLAIAQCVKEILAILGVAVP